MASKVRTQMLLLILTYIICTESSFRSDKQEYRSSQNNVSKLNYFIAKRAHRKTTKRRASEREEFRKNPILIFLLRDEGIESNSLDSTAHKVHFENQASSGNKSDSNAMCVLCVFNKLDFRQLFELQRRARSGGSVTFNY